MKILHFASIILLSSVILFSCKEKKADTVSADDTTTETTDPELRALNDRIKSDPSNYKNYFDRAKYFGTKEKYKQALEDLQRAQLADSTKGEIYLYRGEIYYFNKNIDDAYRQYAECLRFESGNTDCLLKKAEIDIAQGNFEKSLEHINNALRENERLPFAYYLKGRLYLEPGVLDTNLSASSFQTAIELNPDFYEAYYELGNLYAAQKSDLAIEYYNTALSLQPESVESWYAKGLYLQETGYKSKNRYAKAFECYDKIEQLMPIDARPDFNKGYIYLEYKSMYDSAAVYFSKSIEKYPAYFQAYYNRGLCYESLDKKQEAESDYNMALKINPQYDAAAIALDRLLK